MDSISEQIRKQQEKKAAMEEADRLGRIRWRQQAKDYYSMAEKIGPLLANVVAAKKLVVPITWASRRDYDLSDVQRTGLFGRTKEITDADRQRLRGMREREEERLEERSSPAFHIGTTWLGDDGAPEPGDRVNSYQHVYTDEYGDVSIEIGSNPDGLSRRPHPTRGANYTDFLIKNIENLSRQLVEIAVEFDLRVE
jgi:hypothetical protein